MFLIFSSFSSLPLRGEGARSKAWAEVYLCHISWLQHGYIIMQSWYLWRLQKLIDRIQCSRTCAKQGIQLGLILYRLEEHNRVYLMHWPKTKISSRMGKVLAGLGRTGPQRPTSIHHQIRCCIDGYPQPIVKNTTLKSLRFFMTTRGHSKYWIWLGFTKQADHFNISYKNHNSLIIKPIMLYLKYIFYSVIFFGPSYQVCNWCLSEYIISTCSI